MKKIVLALGIVIAFSSTSFAECYSDGIRIGTVQKISAKGYINKSWEGELIQEGIKSTSKGGISNIWQFSTLDAKVAKVIEEAAMTGRPVALKYCQRNPLIPHLDINTTYEITMAVQR